MTKRWLAIAAFLILSGCGTSPEPQFFVLDAVPPTTAPRDIATSISVDTVSIPDYLDRPELVRHVSANQIDMSDVSRWGSALGPMIRDTLIQDLALRLGPGDVEMPERVVPGAKSRLVVVRIHEFAVDEDDRVALDAAWSILDPDGKKLFERRQSFAVDLEGGGADAQAKGMSRALAELADAIVAELPA